MPAVKDHIKNLTAGIINYARIIELNQPTVSKISPGILNGPNYTQT